MHMLLYFLINLTCLVFLQLKFCFEMLFELGSWVMVPTFEANLSMLVYHFKLTTLRSASTIDFLSRKSGKYN